MLVNVFSSNQFIYILQMIFHFIRVKTGHKKQRHYDDFRVIAIVWSISQKFDLNKKMLSQFYWTPPGEAIQWFYPGYVLHEPDSGGPISWHDAALCWLEQWTLAT